MRADRLIDAIAANDYGAVAGADHEAFVVVGDLGVHRSDAGIAGNDDGTARVAAEHVRAAGVECSGLPFQPAGQEKEPRLPHQRLDQADQEADAGPEDDQADGAPPGLALAAEAESAEESGQAVVGGAADQPAQEPAQDAVADLDWHLVGYPFADADQHAKDSPADGARPDAAPGLHEDE